MVALWLGFDEWDDWEVEVGILEVLLDIDRLPEEHLGLPLASR